MISVIIPTRDEEATIAGAISQFASLSLPHETVVSDNGSNDGTVTIARSLADRVVILDGQGHTIACARNAGARASRGSILVFIDSDARVPDPDRYLQHAMARFAAEPDLLGIAAPQRVYPGIERFSDKFVFILDNLCVRMISNVFRYGAGSGKLMFIRQCAFEQVGGFDDGLVFREDADLMRRIAKIGRTHFDPALTVYHSGRRLRRLGVFRFFYSWWVNGLYVHVTGKARDREWKPIR